MVQYLNNYYTMKYYDNISWCNIREGKGKLGAYAMKRVTAGAHLPRPWLFEPAKLPDDRPNFGATEFSDLSENSGPVRIFSYSIHKPHDGLWLIKTVSL